MLKLLSLVAGVKYGSGYLPWPNGLHVMRRNAEKGASHIVVGASKTTSTQRSKYLSRWALTSSSWHVMYSILLPSLCYRVMKIFRSWLLYGCLATSS